MVQAFGRIVSLTPAEKLSITCRMAVAAGKNARTQTHKAEPERS